LRSVTLFPEMPRMKLLLASLLFLLLTACAPTQGLHLVGQPAPYTRLTMLDGRYVPLESFKGRTTVLVFWAEWCTSSSPVMRRLNEYAQTFRGREDVAFVAVSLDRAEDIGKVKERIMYQRLDGFQHAFSGNEGQDEAFMAFSGSTMPYILVIGPDGRVVATDDSDGFVREFVR